MYKRVVGEFEKIPEIVECHFTTGPYTMLVKLYARDNAHLMELLNNRLQEIEGVISTETLISLKQSIKKEVPIGLSEADIAAIQALTAKKAALLSDTIED
jgi:Lrp/AsnC family transcriptional regulator for asnA, asnC and gidA